MTRVKRPTETKVIAARATAGGFALIGGALVWLLGVWVWGASADATKANLAVAAVPLPISALIVPALAWIGAHVGGWLAPHTPRPDLVTHPLGQQPEDRRNVGPVTFTDPTVTMPLPRMPQREREPDLHQVESEPPIASYNDPHDLIGGLRAEG